MILVDTTIFIDFFNDKITNEYTDEFEKIIKLKIPYGINNYVYLELLQGVKSENEFKELKFYLDSQKFYYLNGQESFSNAANMYFKCRKSGFTINSTNDFLIAQTALENDLYLFHKDSDFNDIKKVIKELKIF